MIRRIIRTALIVVVIGALGVFAWTLIHATLYAPGNEVPNPILTATAPSAHAPSSSLPSRLIIPALHIDANVQKAGLKPDGAMGTPDNFTDVAWYKYGAIQGQMGSAVIDGHVDNGLSLPGVFKHLSDIQVGDSVYVQQANGDKLHFVVREVEVYPYKNAPDDLIFGRDDAARLNLITCDGAWVKGGDTYDERLVVYTTLVSS